jgi:hypothetical protein
VRLRSARGYSRLQATYRGFSQRMQSVDVSFGGESESISAQMSLRGLCPAPEAARKLTTIHEPRSMLLWTHCDYVHFC